MKHETGRINRFIAIVREGFRLSPSLFFLGLGQTLLTVLTSTINLLSTKILLGSLRSQQAEDFLLSVLLIFGGNSIISFISAFISPRYSQLSEELKVKVTDGFLRKSSRIQLGLFESRDFYNKYTLVFSKCSEVFQNDISCFFQIISAILHIIVTLAFLSWMQPLYIWILFVFAILQTWIGNHIKKINYNFQLKTVAAKKKLNYIYRLFYVPEFVRDIRANDIWDFIFGKKDFESDQIINEIYCSQKTIRNKRFLQILISFLESVIVVAYFGYQVFRNVIWLDTFVVSQNSYAKLKNAIMNLLSISNLIYENDLYTIDYIAFMKEEETIVLSDPPLSLDRVDEIEFCDVSFRYPSGSTMALNNVSFRVHKGEKVLLTGKNGSGKTTAIKLLLRLYEPTNGIIRINGIDIRMYDLSSLRKSFSVMFQDYVIYAFSLYDNLCLSRNVAPEHLQKTLESLGLSKVISQLKNGLNTPFSCQLDDDGVELSSGERQRMAIGRALLKQSPILILDEPTSNLDSITAESFVSSLFSNNSSTLIYISHRLSVSCRFSKIICFDKGSIVEEGTHACLCGRKGGTYAQLYQTDHERR